MTEKKTKNLKNHKIVIAGLQGSGKSVLARHIIETRFKSAVGIRLTNDFDNLKNMVQLPLTDKYSEDLDKLVELINQTGREVENGLRKNNLFDALVIDEADLYFTNNSQISKPMSELLAMHRHYEIAIIFVTRRLQDIPPKIVESSKYRFFFIIEGKNVEKYLENQDKNLLFLMKKLDFDKHNYIFKEIGRPPKLMKPINLDKNIV